MQTNLYLNHFGFSRDNTPSRGVIPRTFGTKIGEYHYIDSITHFTPRCQRAGVENARIEVATPTLWIVQLKRPPSEARGILNGHQALAGAQDQ
jgi:hypothetical protein